MAYIPFWFTTSKKDVKTLKKGDFVIAPFAFSDGTCPNCQPGFQTACTHGGFFGQGVEGDGGQAELTRVPQADGTLVVVPGADFSDETLASLLTLSDVLGTGYHAAVSAEVKQGGHRCGCWGWCHSLGENTNRSNVNH